MDEGGGWMDDGSFSTFVLFLSYVLPTSYVLCPSYVLCLTSYVFPKILSVAKDLSLPQKATLSL